MSSDRVVPDLSSQERSLPITLREETAADESFLRRLFASVRQEELDLTGWNRAQCEAFLAMQFEAQRQTYRTIFAQAQFAIILLESEAIGRIIIDRTPEEIRVVDMALLTEHRGKEIGTKLMRELQSEAAQNKKPLRLRVYLDCRAKRFYERLGFRKLDESGLHEQMEWREQ
jgi:GNAT superfamily N-acetyltransferase